MNGARYDEGYSFGLVDGRKQGELTGHNNAIDKINQKLPALLNKAKREGYRIGLNEGEAKGVQRGRHEATEAAKADIAAAEHAARNAGREEGVRIGLDKGEAQKVVELDKVRSDWFAERETNTVQFFQYVDFLMNELFACLPDDASRWAVVRQAMKSGLAQNEDFRAFINQAELSDAEMNEWMAYLEEHPSSVAELGLQNLKSE